jgi:hypothetical protein
MPMNPMLAQTLRRQWPAAAAIALLVVLTIVNQLWFQPTAQRYARTIKRATSLGMPLDPNQMPRMMPPRLFALIADNTLPAGQAQDAANSGSLTAEFLGELTDRMRNRDLSLISTEPGPVSQDSRTIQLRAHLRVRSRYGDFAKVLDDLAQDRRLFSIERFSVTPDDPPGMLVIDLYMGRLVLKSGGHS